MPHSFTGSPKSETEFPTPGDPKSNELSDTSRRKIIDLKEMIFRDILYDIERN